MKTELKKGSGHNMGNAYQPGKAVGISRQNSLHIEFTTDLLCPWCYIAKHRLNKALSAVYAPVNIQWQFQPLFPDLTTEGALFSDFIRRHYNNQTQTRQIYNQLQLSALKDGLKLNLAQLKSLPYPVPAYQMIVAAHDWGRQDELGMLIYQALFEENMDISRWEVLQSLASFLDLPEECYKTAKNGQHIQRIVQAQISQGMNQSEQQLPRVQVNHGIEMIGLEEVSQLITYFDEILFSSFDTQVPERMM